MLPDMFSHQCPLQNFNQNLRNPRKCQIRLMFLQGDVEDVRLAGINKTFFEVVHNFFWNRRKQLNSMGHPTE